MRQAILTSLVSAFAIALILEAWLKPAVTPTPLEGLVVVFSVQVVAILLSRWLAPARGTRAVKALISAALLSGVVVVALKPTVQVGFDELFVLVGAFELAALGLGVYLARPGAVAGE